MIDSLTMHYVARELDERWRGRRIDACHVDRHARTVVLWCDASEPVTFDLRALTIHAANAEPRGELLHGWKIHSVEAPVDERRLLIHCERAGKFRGSPSKQGALELIFVPNARGALVRDAGHVLASVGNAPLPAAAPRPILDDETLRTAVVADDVDTMARGRWMSPQVCAALVTQPERAVELYHMILSLPPAAPTRCGSVLFPLPLCAEGTSVSSLIAPAQDERARPGKAGDRAPRAIERMRRELERARDAPRLRAIADALTGLGDRVAVPETVVLADGSVAPVPNPGDPAATPVSVAQRFYRDARAMERALETLPARIAELETDAVRSSSEATPSRRKAAEKAPRRVPYKSYRSSGGIDILVGRGAASNDELTYKIAKPDEVWLHARDVTGAHVVMRWSQQGSPPTRDLHEAAALAAWHSRARGSVVVPVDWTRRRYVKRARGGPPGRALVERAKTVMARPSAELERRLRKNEAQGMRK